jgi:hypothetical protein
MASDSGSYNKNSQNNVPAPLGYTRLTDAGGQTYLVPDFILPAATFSATSEDRKAAIDASQMRVGVSFFSLFFCRAFSVTVAGVCRTVDAYTQGAFHCGKSGSYGDNCN